MQYSHLISVTSSLKHAKAILKSADNIFREKTLHSLLILQQGSFMFHTSRHSYVPGQFGGLVVRQENKKRREKKPHNIERLAFIEEHHAKKTWILTNNHELIRIN